ncbi:DUF4185 domain-containing protein [Cyclobacterium jeungdonense]|uniref:DUF4185 domain-containing protein n=1 Tax=Cyclobacterium jeungdonense TaxID=708087 RepID=A0ABT8C5G6_9BACT|nr:DUF4185 domain-containing protein [Cyclobacterium jeungdonense]MDN3687312.1 DUF4185 domain-containing protein [Cyclobacterium jeungdonense]
MIPTNTSITELQFTVKEAANWTNLFKRTSGWFGGDGIFTIPLDGLESAVADTSGKTLVLFSDSLIGEITDGKLDSPFVMINNSVAWMHGAEPIASNISFHWALDEQNAPLSLFIPNTPNSKPGEYFWLGDGFVNQARNNDIYLFGYRITTTGADAFNFKEVGNTLIVLPSGSKPPFEDQRQIDTPFYMDGKPESTGSFGAGILVNTKDAGALRPDGYVYIYGVKGIKKEVMVARVKPKDIEKFDLWKFWDGTSWQSEMKQAASIAERASNELSVTSLEDGRYAMVFQTDGIASTVGLRLSQFPEGPFGPIITIWDASADLSKGKHLISYNAKAHPSLSMPGELLISYNINSFDFFADVEISPNFYRPRFIRLKIGD